MPGRPCGRVRPVLLADDGPVLVVTVNRPQTRNAVDAATARALAEAWDRLRDDDAVRAAVLTGAGDAAFCAGADLASLDSMEEARGGWLGITRRLDAGKPVVAAVNGAALGGGLELALAADVRIAEEHATFGCTNRKWGVPLVDGGTQRLPRAIGLSRAMDMILTGRVLDAPTALAWGLVTEVVPRGAARARAVALAHELAAFPQAALLADRASAYDGAGRGLGEGLRREAQRGRHVIREPGFAERVRARFAQRRR